MIREGLGDLSIEAFRAEYLARAPVARPATLRTAQLLDWTAVDEVLRSGEADILPVSDGALVACAVPQTPPSSAGCSVRRSACAFARRSAGTLPSLASRATSAPRSARRRSNSSSHRAARTASAGTMTTSTCSSRRPRARRITTSARIRWPPTSRRRAPHSPRTARRRRLSRWPASSPATFYIPARWWHVALWREESLSISIGVRAA